MKSASEGIAQKSSGMLSLLKFGGAPQAGDGTTSGKNVVLWSAVGALMVVGVSTYVYSIFHRRSEQKKKQKLLESKKKRQLPANVPIVLGPDGEPMTQEELLTPSFLRRTERRVRVYFDRNDDLVEEAVAQADPNNYYHKYHVVEIDFKPVDYEDDDDDLELLQELAMGADKGKAATAKQILQSKSKIEKITKDTFYGEKPADNAEIFIDSIQKTRKKHLKKVQERELLLAGGTINNNDVYRPASEDEEDENEDTVSSSLFVKQARPAKEKKDPSVILDLNPEKYEKPKDHLFFDFFSMYTKNFIGAKKPK